MSLLLLQRSATVYTVTHTELHSTVGVECTVSTESCIQCSLGPRPSRTCKKNGGSGTENTFNDDIFSHSELSQYHGLNVSRRMKGLRGVVNYCLTL